MDLEQVDIDVGNFRLDITDVEGGTAAEAAEDLALGTEVDMLSVVGCVNLGVITVIEDVREATTGDKEDVTVAAVVDGKDDVAEMMDGKDVMDAAAEKKDDAIVWAEGITTVCVAVHVSPACELSSVSKREEGPSSPLPKDE